VLAPREDDTGTPANRHDVARMRLIENQSIPIHRARIVCHDSFVDGWFYRPHTLATRGISGGIFLDHGFVVISRIGVSGYRAQHTVCHARFASKHIPGSGRDCSPDHVRASAAIHANGRLFDIRRKCVAHFIVSLIGEYLPLRRKMNRRGQ